MEAIGSKHRIGGYRIIAPIGVGSSSTVFRALDESSHTEVAIKVLADNHSHLPEMRHRFVDEVELLSTIKSPTIAKIYKVGETENHQPFMVLELADRGNLRRRLEDLRRSSQSVDVADLLLLAEHLAEALGTLHNAGIVHRDVSPGNVLIKSGLPTITRNSSAGTADEPGLLRSDERFLLIDLGFAKDLQYASGLTAGGGTRGFAAPEQRDDITVIDHRSDIYSATALLEWVSARSNISQSSNAASFDAFIDIGLADEPDDRYASMSEWLTAARQVLTVSPPATDSKLTRTIAMGRPKQSMLGSLSAKTLMAIGGAIAILGVGIGAFVGLRSTGDEIAAQIDEPEQRESNQADDRARALGPETDLESSIPQPPLRVEDESTTSDSITDGATATSSESATGSSSESPATTQTEESNQSSATSPATTDPTRTTSGPTTARQTSQSPTTTTQRATSQQLTTTVRESTTQRPTTQRPTTQQPTTVTLGPTTSIQRYRNSPRAYIESPASEAVVQGNLTLSGTATYPIGNVEEVQITIWNEQTGLYWYDSTSSFETKWVRFPVSVSPSGGQNVTWSYTVKGDGLEPGRYLLRVWAQATAGNGDPISDRRYITITG